MKALQLTDWKHEPELREVAEPDPGPGQLVIEVGGSGACHSDLHLIHDFDAGLLPYELPFTLGHENAGWIHGLGDGVDGLEVGEPVAVYGPWGCGRCHRCRQGLENYCMRQAEIGAAGGGLGRNGGMARYMLIPDPRFVVPIGDLDPVDAAPLTDAALTPYHAIKRSMHLLGAGSTTVVIGAGGLGHMAIQILRALTGTTVIAVDQRPEALAVATAAGADHAVVSGDSAAAEVLALTKGVGADVVIDLVGVDPTLALAASVVRSMGHLSIVGIGGGTIPIGFFSIGYEVSVATTYWGSIPELMDVVALAQSGKIAAEVTRFGLADASSAYQQLHAGTLTGRAVIEPKK